MNVSCAQRTGHSKEHEQLHNTEIEFMPGLLANIDPDGLLEYSVVFTDRSLNHMSQSFQGVMNEISLTLKSVYQAEAVAIVSPASLPQGINVW